MKRIYADQKWNKYYETTKYVVLLLFVLWFWFIALNFSNIKKFITEKPTLSNEGNEVGPYSDALESNFKKKRLTVQTNNRQ